MVLRCQTYKYIGQKHTKRTTQVEDRVVDTEWLNPAGPLGSPFKVSAPRKAA